MMAVPWTHVRYQLPVIRGLIAAARATAASAGRTGGEMSLPGPLLQADLPARDKQLVADYLRVVGGNASAWGKVTPWHFFPQWAFPLLTATLADVPYDLRRVLNGGCRIELRQPIPSDEPLHVTAQLVDVDANERRVVLHQVVTTGTISAPDALVAHFYPIVPLAKLAKGGAKAPPKDPVVIPANAREIDTWRLGPKAGLDFALVTGDFNPIHWVGFAARMAGFKNVILHGFAELARSVEGLQRNVLMGDTRRICEIDVRFVKPLVLPRTTSLFLLRLPDGDQPGAFAVGDAPGAPAFLTGTFRLRD
jgi:hypothetical protein